MPILTDPPLIPDVRPLVSLYEGWQDELGIDFTVWTVTNPATGVAWSRGANGAYLRATSIPNANENARIRSNQRWIAAPTVYGTNTTLRKLILEFEFRLTGLANIDQANAIFGLTSGIADTRVTANIIGFALAANVAVSLTDLAGVETTNTGFGDVLTNWNKLKILIQRDHVRFFINESQVADHVANIPSLPMYLNFYLPTGAGGAATVELGVTRCWTEDIVKD